MRGGSPLIDHGGMTITVEPMPMQADLVWFPEGWSAVWGVFGQREGYESSDTDLRTLISRIVESARDWALGGSDPLTPREGCDMTVLRIWWTVGGDVPPQGSVAGALAVIGVALPSTAAEWPDRQV